MGYAHLINLYRPEAQVILMFKEVWAMEKIHGCLKKGTLVLMADKTEKPIETVKAGDEVVVFDELSKTFKKSSVNELVVQESDSRLGWMEVVLGNGRTVVCTVDHPFMTSRGWIRADELDMSDELIEHSL